MSTDQHNSTLSDELGERISAYLDGELSAHEASEVERLIARDPAALRFAEDLARVRQLCRTAPTPSFSRDLSAGVVAEALRRQAAGDGQSIELADRLEPEGEFGLPFGKASRTWAWAGVAVAAALLIGFYGRPGAPAGRAVVTPTQMAQNLRAMQQAVPGMQVVNFQATPEMVARLRQRLSMPSAHRAQLPGELMTVSEPADPAPSAQAGEQLLYVDAEEAELDRLLSELSSEEKGSLVQVEKDRGATPAPTAPTPQPGLRAVPLRVKLSPEDLSRLIQQQKNAATAPGQRRIVVLRIQLQPQPSE